MERATERDADRAEVRTKLVHELFGGVPYPKPRDPLRGRVVMELGLHVGRYLDENDIGFMLESRATFPLRRLTVVSPDFSLVPWDQCPGGKIPWGAYPRLTPVLVADVLGPSSTAERIALRHREYFRAGVRLVWVIDPAKRTAAVHTEPTAATVIPESGTLDGGDVLPGFRLPVPKLFEWPTPPKR
ncbi:MAG: Uma2 family endonuclease [Gemmataceae bacterium]|nr:Uma2 family endonuclease [Gemmataceae bacterium]